MITFLQDALHCVQPILWAILFIAGYLGHGQRLNVAFDMIKKVPD
jgi:hypothetical protein